MSALVKTGEQQLSEYRTPQGEDVEETLEAGAANSFGGPTPPTETKEPTPLASPVGITKRMSP